MIGKTEKIEKTEKTKMQLLNARLTIIAGLLVAMGVAPSSGIAAPHDRDHPVAQESANGNGTPSLPASQMQVSGTTNNFTISAQHADILSLLKLVFDQAHRQFVPDASVTGDVTFALSGQKFDTVLASICKQAFLRVDVDKNGVYQFRRDDEALRNLILKTRAINAVLQEQLRRMGYAVPSGGPGTGFGTGGFGGGGRPTSPSSNGVTQGIYGRSQGSGVSDQASVSRDQNSVAGQSKTQPDPVLSAPAAKRSDMRVRSSIGAQGPQGSAGPFGDNRSQTPARPDAEQRASGAQDNVGRSAAMGLAESDSPNLDNGAQYQLFLRQNRLVTINTKGQDVPVRDVLSDLGRQSGVAILIDPAVPRGMEFVVNASIPPRPLNEVLNILASRAHLEWRWLNNRIFITTTPQLLLYLRGTQLPTLGGITILPQRPILQQNTAPSTDQKAEEKKTDGQANKEKPKGN
jgi:hypothetical protein